MTYELKQTRLMLGVVVACSVIGLSGCRSGGGSRTAKAEPSLSGVTNDDIIISDAPSVAAAPPAGASGSSAYVDRHPLFSKPRQYWDNSGDNKIVKAAAATFIGVPAGFVGEMKQIVVGVPSEQRQ